MTRKISCFVVVELKYEKRKIKIERKKKHLFSIFPCLKWFNNSFVNYNGKPNKNETTKRTTHEYNEKKKTTKLI